LDDLLDEDAVRYEAEKNPKGEDPLTKPQREVAEDGTVTITTTSTIPVETILFNSKNGPPSERFYQPSWSGSDDDDSDEYSNGNGGYSDDSIKLDLDDPNSVHIGLRVYTHKDVQVEITSGADPSSQGVQSLGLLFLIQKRYFAGSSIHYFSL